MKQLKRIGALVLALVMALALCATAFADDEVSLSSGEVGGFNPNVDTPTSQPKTVVLKKEITVYNLDESKVWAPTITYKYAIEAGPANVNVTDEAADHATGIGAITVPTKAGLFKTVTESGEDVAYPKMTGTAANEIAWTTADELNASTDGTANTKDLKIDFSQVVFNGAGVYRYKITETPAYGSSYAATGVTQGNTNHVRFLDVYVRPATTGFNDGSTAAEWDIYGYVCIDDGAAGTTAVTPSTTKTNGFVDADTSTTASTADKYYTYNFTISKTVENDEYAKATHAFPFTVIFTNGDINQNILLKTTITATATDFTHNAGAPTWSGHADLNHGSSIKYIGVPMGTDVEVFETNDVTGVTYNVTSTRVNATTETATDAAVTWGSISTSAQANPKADYQSTKTVFDTTKDQDDDNTHSVAINNKLVTISPTGVVLRVAPYVAILVAGIALLVIATRRRKNAEEEA